MHQSRTDRNPCRERRPPKDLHLPVATPDDDEPDAPEDIPLTTIAVPELTHPGESQSNGLAERSVRTVEEQVRTRLAATEANIKTKIPSEHPLLAWLLEHSAYTLNKFGPGKDGKYPYALLHGKQCVERSVEFGEKILWFVHKTLRSKLNQK